MSLRSSAGVASAVASSITVVLTFSGTGVASDVTVALTFVSYGSGRIWQRGLARPTFRPRGQGSYEFRVRGRPGRPAAPLRLRDPFCPVRSGYSGRLRRRLVEQRFQGRVRERLFSPRVVEHLLERFLHVQCFPDLLDRGLWIGGNEPNRLPRVGHEPVLDMGILEAGEALAMREDGIEDRRNIRGGKVVDVLGPRAIEAAAEHEPRVIVEEHPPGFMQGGDLLNGLLATRITGCPLDSLAYRLFVAGLDIGIDRELGHHSRLQSRPLWRCRGWGRHIVPSSL